VRLQLIEASERLQSKVAADLLKSNLPIVELTKAGLI
jgi:hypothetical protein